jgi:N-acetylglucosaminyl-diphospho-decaprenol L-rhamnosyltransferase
MTGLRPTVDVIIVNWNAGGQLHACLSSLVATRQAEFDLSSVIVVDNASTDGSVDELAPYGPWLQVQRNPVNRGFAAACNQAARRAPGDYLLFLNPDTRLEAGSMDAAVAALEAPSHRQAGIASVQLYNQAGQVTRSCARFPSARSMVIRAIGLDRTGWIRGYPMTEWAHDETRVVDHVIGAFYLVRHRVFEELGGFDERFFVYLEDLDFSVRARAAGWYSLYLADARAFHKGGGTSDTVRAARLAHSLRSRLTYARKHFGLLGRAAVTIATVIAEPAIRLSQAALRGSRRDLAAVFGAYRLLLSRQLP